jgi:hypothetical protein
MARQIDQPERIAAAELCRPLSSTSRSWQEFSWRAALHWDRSQIRKSDEPTLPHSDFGDPDCGGCLNGVIRGDQADIVCKEC